MFSETYVLSFLLDFFGELSISMDKGGLFDMVDSRRQSIATLSKGSSRCQFSVGRKKASFT